MRTARWTIAILLVIGLMGCGSDEEESSAPMPDVIGKQLDVAKSDIERAGYGDDVEVLGGGTFGVVNESNWLVCDQLPGEGEPIEDSPRLTVDRSCDDGTDEDPVEPADATVPDTTVPDTTEAPVEEDSPELPAAPAPGPTGIDATAMEAAFITALDGPIEGMCASVEDDPTWTRGPHWACFYDGVEGGPLFLRVNLTTDGSRSKEDLARLVDDTGRHWFNFIGCEFRNLNMIVVTINGLDHNVARSSTDVDLICG